METSILFLMNAGRNVKGRKGRRPAKPSDQKTMEGLKDGGRAVDAPCSTDVVNIDAYAVPLFMAALWGLSEDGVVSLDIGELEKRERKISGVILSWTEQTVHASLVEEPRTRRTSLEGLMVDALTRSSPLSPKSLARASLGRSSPKLAITAARDGAVEQGLLAPCEAGTDGAAMIGDWRPAYLQLLAAVATFGFVEMKAAIPAYFVADCAKVEDLRSAYEVRRAAYKKFRTKNPGFERELEDKWVGRPGHELESASSGPGG